MNFNQWFEIQNKCHKSLYGHDILNKDKIIMQESWVACQNEVLEIINNTPLGYRTEGEHEKLEKFADLIEDKINKL